MSLKKKKKSKPNGQNSTGEVDDFSDSVGTLLTDSLNRLQLKNVNSSSRPSLSSDHSSSTTLTHKNKRRKSEEIEMGIKNVEILDEYTSIHTVEVLKRPGQTLGFYIREGNGKGTKRGVFISRIAEGSIVQKNGLLKVGDEIQAINSVNVTRTNLDDVVVLMSIPKKLILTIKSNRKLDKYSKVSYKESRPVYIHKEMCEDSNSVSKLHLDINPEDSNDSGLSSEHSTKGERPEMGTIVDLPPSSFGYATLPAKRINKQIGEPIYATPRSTRTELCVSDGEHEYTPVPKLRTFKAAPSKKDSKTLDRHHAHLTNGTDAYNSDSELLQGHHDNSIHNTHIQWDPVTDVGSRTVNNSGVQHSNPSPYHGFTSEMQHWLRKFDYMSQELNSHSDDHNNKESTTTAAELDGYRTELWRQEKLLNDAIYNMESALTVDTMLQTSQSNHTLPRNSILTQTAMMEVHNRDRGTAYSYLRDLPLLIKTPMKIQIEDFELYRPEYDKNTDKDVLGDGTMKVKVYCGHGLKSSRTSLRDLYCVIQLDNVKMAKTLIRTGAINFDWDETFNMKVEERTGSLVCMIYHWDPHIRHRLCFTGTIKLTNIFHRGSNIPQNKKCALKLEPRGILYLEISYCSSDQESKSLLFGRSLKETIGMENAGMNIPIIVTKCVSEINSRGLDVVGIYRLCGAAKKKQQLRHEFERHPHLVDLSPVNVPEIHAITGLLKDYLRELPDCLLTEKAYKTAERALTKDSTQDADQDSIEIVNEFVASLHPWQQGTVVFLLNHMKLISLHQAVNRMTTANLAVCYGPIFTPPSERYEGDKDATEATSVKLHIEVIKYLLDIWPQNYSTNNNVVI